MYVKVMVTSTIGITGSIPITDALVFVRTSTLSETLTYIPGTYGVYGLGMTCWSHATTDNTAITVDAYKTGYQSDPATAYTDDNPLMSPCP